MTRQFKKGFFVTCNLFSATCLALLIAPSSAQAQCAPPTGTEAVPAPATGTVTCQPGDYATGIHYDSTGDLVLEVPDGTGNLTVNDDGLNVTGSGTDNVALDASAFANQIEGTDGAIIDYSSGTGTIDIDTSGTLRVLGDGNATHGIRALSGSGSIDILTNQVITDNDTPDFTAIEAITGGGDITVTGIEDRQIGNSGNPGTIRNGIIAETSGAGSIVIDAPVLQAGARNVAEAVYAIRAVTGTGDISIASDEISFRGASLPSADESIAVYVSTVGAITLDLGTVNGAFGAGIVTENSELVTLNVTGYIGSRINANNFATALRSSGTAIVASFSDELQENFGARGGIHGATVDLSGITDSAEMHFNANTTWQLTATDNMLASGGDTVTFAPEAALYTHVPDALAGIDFGAGDDLLTLSGEMAVGITDGIRGLGGTDVDEPSPNELRLENLETFENSGSIYLGARLSEQEFQGIDETEVIAGSDTRSDDILSMPGTTFVGSGNSRVFLDVNLNSISDAQDRCDPSLRDGDGSLPAADCINLQNGATEGETKLVVTQTDFGGRGAYNPNGYVIVDMSDGNGGPGSGAGGEPGGFVFDESSRYYNPAFGGVVDNGMFMYRSFYDAEMKQYKIVSVPSAGAFHQTLIANAAQSAWRTANGSFFDRQADLRDTVRRGQVNDHGVWARVAREGAERETEQTFTIEAGDIVYDNTHDIDTDAVTVGVDFVRGSNGAGHWVAGGMIGYVRTDMEYARFWTDTARMNGMMAGFYGSYVNGPLFVDTSVSGNWTRLVQDMPQAELFRERDLSSDVETLGARLEAGWRFDLGVARVEPLVNAAWSVTDMDDFKVPEDDPARPGNQVMFDKTTSQRIGLGLRGSREFSLSRDLVLGVSLTGRVQEELDGEATAKIGNLNPIAPEVKDEFDGTFSEVVGGLTLTNSTGRVSGVLNVGSKFGDDYDALSASASFRYQW